MAAVSLIWRNSDVIPDEDFFSRMLAGALVALLDQLNLELGSFYATLTFQPRSAVVLHRKLWGTIPQPSLPKGHLGSEQMIDVDGGRVRFVAAARIPNEEVRAWAESRGLFQLAVPVLLPRTPDPSGAADTWAKLAFPPAGEARDFDWPTGERDSRPSKPWHHGADPPGGLVQLFYRPSQPVLCDPA